MNAMASARDRAERNGEPFDLLSSHRRRWTLRICTERQGPLELGDLAEQIAAMEQDKEIEDLTMAERKRVYTSLQQTHIPRLEEAGVVEAQDKYIDLTPRASELDVYLDGESGSPFPWPLYYLTVSTVAVVSLGIAWTGVLPGNVPWPAVVGTMGVLAFGASAAVHAYLERQGRIVDPPFPEEVV